jgi:hypothetical protein
MEAFMLIFKEKEQLDEMAIRVVSSRKDGLPFRITIKAPDHLPPHAYIMDLETGKKELGQFLLFPDLPRTPGDIKNYRRGISDEWKSLIFRWEKSRCVKFPVAKNWEVLWFEWQLNEAE